MVCFFQAFHDYYVDLFKDHGYYEKRWRMAKVQYDLSFGVFHHGNLVGFVLHAIDTRDGLLTAYNACTGVLPEYRGQKLIHSIYDHSIPVFKANGIKRCTLEVITENIRAIKTYTSIGFRTTKLFHCFSGNLNGVQVQDQEIREVEFDVKSLMSHSSKQWYSWENHVRALARGNFRAFEIHVNNQVESFFIMAPTGGYVAQIEVMTDNILAWDRLFSIMSRHSVHIKINNVDSRLSDKITHLLKAGLQNKLNQFEMEMTL